MDSHYSIYGISHLSTYRYPRIQPNFVINKNIFVYDIRKKEIIGQVSPCDHLDGSILEVLHFENWTLTYFSVTAAPATLKNAFSKAVHSCSIAQVHQCASIYGTRAADRFVNK